MGIGLVHQRERLVDAAALFSTVSSMPSAGVGEATTVGGGGAGGRGVGTPGMRITSRIMR